MEINGFEVDKFNVHGFKEGEKYSTCPSCSKDRKKKDDKCLSLFWDSGIGNCNHCGELIQLHTYKSKELKPNYIRPEFKYSQLDDKIIKYFEGRGISQQTLAHVKITQGLEWMPQTKKEENVICFNYFLDGKLINTKYRDGRKNFKLYKGAEKIFYNLDSIRINTECLVVEGEIDVLSFIESGYYSVVSVPNGFNLKGTINLDYLDDYLEYFDNKEKIYLSLDNDEAGIKGRNEFIRRLGAERCYLVDLKDCKDGNEYLVKYGKESLLKTIGDAKLSPLENVCTIDDYSDQLDSFWLNGLPKGMTIGVPELDDIYSAEMGQYTLVTGVPQSGKSEFLDYLVVRQNLKSGNKVCFTSIENEPFTFHYDKLVQKLYGRKPNRNDIGGSSLNEVKEYIKNNYSHVQFDKRYFLDEVLNKFREVRKRKGTRIFIIDPYNKVKLKGSYSNANDFANEYHSMLDEFVKETNSHLYVVLHPTKVNYAEGSKMSYNMPSAYQMKGGGEHFDMSYNVLGVNRIYEQKIVHVKTLKIKFRHLGEQQKSVFWSYNTVNGRYELPDYQPYEIDFKSEVSCSNLDYTNWLKPEESSFDVIKPNEWFDENDTPF